MKTYFVTGTDTDVGKTLVTTGLLQCARQQGLSSLAIKPVAAGCEPTANGLRNADALALLENMTARLSYEQVNPIALRAAIAPHIAARQEQRRLSVQQLSGFCRGVMMQRTDIGFIEGAGGWRVPLNERETLADLVRELQLPVILVVAVRLGCINHSLLTVEAIQRDGLTLAGWVANLLEPDMPALAENLETLRQQIDAPCLGELPLLTKVAADQAAGYLQLPSL